MVKNTRLVYSTDPKENVLCPHCRHLKAECKCPSPQQMPNKVTAKLRIEKSGRGGKVVTVIDGLPKVESFLKDLSKELKNKFGTGGTYSMEKADGIVEVQGERIDKLREYLKTKNWIVKG